MRPLKGLIIILASSTFLIIVSTKVLSNFTHLKIPLNSRYALVPVAFVMLIWMGLFSGSLKPVLNATIDYLPGYRRQIQQTETRPANSLVYKNVKETIVEAKVSPWSEVMVRISGSQLGCLLALAGYVLLVIIFPETLIALPFVGIGIFAHYGGHRFTIHAVPIAALREARPASELPGIAIV